MLENEPENRPDSDDPKEVYGDPTPEDEEEARRTLEKISQIERLGEDANGEAERTRIEERRAKLRRTILVNLSVSSEWNPEDEKTFNEILELYERNLIPERAFYHMVQGEDADFRKTIYRGGMLNRAVPTEKERVYYSRNYETVADQMLLDLIGYSKRPGRYSMTGLRDEDGKLVASASYRLPPKENKEEYIEYLRRVFSKVNLHNIDREELESRFDSMMEVDTINVDRCFRGGGTKILADTFNRIHIQEGGAVPKWVFYYRHSILKLLNPSYASNYGSGFSAGENTASAQLFSRIGFDTLGYRKEDEEIVAREVSNIDGDVVVFQPTWDYGMALIDTAECLARRRYENILGMHHEDE
ncbi:hypothetical protein KKF55_00515 [Patescibacteria group bacterium]|nr:hypothetical protein [Patescibacteria group bacterium]